MQPNKFEFIADKIRNDGHTYEEAQLLYHLKIGLGVDRERNVQHLKQQVEAGTYPVTGAQVAGRMLCAEHGTPVSDAGCTFCRVQEENDAARQTEEEAARQASAMEHDASPVFLPFYTDYAPELAPQEEYAWDRWLIKAVAGVLILVAMMCVWMGAINRGMAEKHEREIREGRR